MIRPLALTDSLCIDGSDAHSESVALRTEISDYLYLVADCLTVVFHESDALGLSESDLMDAANRYLDEARTSLGSMTGHLGGFEMPSQLGAPDEIPAAATELSRRARLLEDAELWDPLS